MKLVKISTLNVGDICLLPCAVSVAESDMFTFKICKVLEVNQDTDCLIVYAVQAYGWGALRWDPKDEPVSMWPSLEVLI